MIISSNICGYTLDTLPTSTNSMSSTVFLNRAKEIISSTTTGDEVRNICIIAHVDHGKTTLSDFLLASNKHVSVRQIENGQKTGEAVRFLDSRMDEINRQITIKSSCVSLVYDKGGPTYVVNLIDSPGHVDFSAEVSAAARLTDGGIIVVDCIEGVRAQTCTVIRQAWDNRIVPILFINKLDRMVELVEDCGEAYLRIRNIIENVNIQFHNLLEAYKEEKELAAIPDHLIKQYQFDATQGNVLFGSALHGWGFGLGSWTEKLVAPKMMTLFPGQEKDQVCEFLQPYMFGQFQVPRRMAGAPAMAESPSNTMFAKVVLEQIWALYNRDVGMAKSKLCDMFPIADAIFESVVCIVPSPKKAISERAKIFTSDDMVFESQDESTTTVFLVKHHPADLVVGCLLGDRVDNVRSLNGFVSISRVFSGSVQVGTKFFVVSADDPSKSVLTVKRIYMLMGSSLMPITRAGPGSVVGLEFSQDMDEQPAAGATLSTNVDSPSFVSPYEMAHAIVRVTAEVVKSADEERLDEGLRLLSRSDPAVVVTRHQQTGERIVGCCGDEHLARCIQDLENLFAVGISLRISAPIVEIRESVGTEWLQPGEDEEEDVGDYVNKLPSWLSEFAGTIDMKNRNKSVSIESPDKTCAVTISAAAIPEKAMDWIEHWRQPLRMIFHERHAPTGGHLWPHVKDKTLEGCIQSVTDIMSGFGVSNIVDMHVKNEAINILTCAESVPDTVRLGFQQACMDGPLAEEPVRGVVWNIDALRVSTDHPSSTSFAINFACRASILASPVRVSEPMLSLEIQTEEIKATQSVLATRRADIFHSDLVEGSYSEYLIKALLPASEAFRLGDKSKLTFSDELRGATHGKVVWRLSFSHWALVNTDSPLTQGISQKLVCNVRKRKGLSIGEKVVDDPDKQRTLTKMK